MKFLKMITQIKLQITPITILAILSLALLYMQPATAQTIEVDKIVAVVNDEVITQSDINRILAAIQTEYSTSVPERNIINQIVEEKLILSEAKKYGIKGDEEQTEARIEQIKQNFPNEEEFAQALESQGLAIKDLKERFNQQQIMKKAVDYFVKSKIEVDPQELQQFYQSHQEELVHPQKAKVKTILIRMDESHPEHQALQTARMILGRLKKGYNFEELARTYSQGANAQEGGSLGFIEQGQWIKEIDEVVFKLNPGEFSDVIKTQQGYRIFKVVAKEPQKPLTFSQAQETIRQILYSEKFTQTFQGWIESLKQDAYISIKENLGEVESSNE